MFGIAGPSECQSTNFDPASSVSNGMLQQAGWPMFTWYLKGGRSTGKHGQPGFTSFLGPRFIEKR